MVWALLALVGVPLWLCALGILTLLNGNRRLRKRPGDIPARLLMPGKHRWVRGHAVWVSDVFAWRASPAAWEVYLEQIVEATSRDATAAEKKALHRLGDAPVVGILVDSGGAVLRVATTRDHAANLLGPFAIGAGTP